MFLGIHGPFLLDDIPNLEFARLAGEDWLSWYRAIFGNESGLFRRPLANASFLINVKVFGPHALSFKLVNIILHALTALLIFAFCQRLLRLLLPQETEIRRAALALGAAAVWIIHPLQVSTGLYVVQRMTQLASIGMLASLIVALGFLGKPSPSKRQTLAALAGTILFAFIGLAGKEIAALTPLLLLVVIATTPKPANPQISGTSHRFFCIVAAYLPSLALLVAAAYLLVDINSAYQARSFTFAERAFTQPFVLGHYLSTIFVPDIRKMGLYLDGFPIETPWTPRAWFGIVTVTMVLLGALWQRQRSSLVSFCVLWFLACHAIESSIIPLELAFEHRNYLAILGPALLLARCGQLLGQVLRPTLHRLVISAVFVVLAVSTASRSHQWGSPTLFIRAEALHHPTSPRALNSVASLEFELGNFEAARENTKRLESLYPNSFWSNALHLIILACTNEPGEPQYARLLGIAQKQPHDRAVSMALISVFSNILRHKCDKLDPDQLDRFMGQLTSVVQSISDLERIYILRAMFAEHRGADKLHRLHLESAIAANPDGIEARLLLGYLHLNQGEIDAASLQLEMLRQIIRRGPEMVRVEELAAYIDMERQEINRRAVPAD